MKRNIQNIKTYLLAILTLIAMGKTTTGLAQCVTSASFGPTAVTESFEGYTLNANNTVSQYGSGYTVPGTVSSFTFTSGITLTAPVPNSNQYVLIGDFAQGSATWGLTNGGVGSAADVPSGNAFLGLFDPNGNAVTATFTLPVNSKKVGMLVEGEPGNITLTAYNSANAVIGTCSIATTSNAANWSTQFLGFNTPAGDIAKVEVTGITAIVDEFTFEAATTYSPPGIVWGTSPFQDSLWAFDAVNNFAIVHAFGPYITGGPAITGMTGLAFDPCGYKTYGIAKLSGVTGRVLVTVDLATGECTQVGNLGADFTSLTFRKDGQLLGTTGTHAPAETLFLIDKNTAATTVAIALGNGADGEVICYNPVDDNIYHWSGNGTVVYEYFPSQTPYTPVINIPITGTAGGETFGALHWNQDTFLVSNIASHFKFATTSGVYGNDLSSNPDDIRGLAMPPVFTIADDTICLHDVITLTAAAVSDYQVIYVWGDGSADTVTAGSGLSHTYTSSGNYTINVILHYGDCPAAVYWSHAVRVNALPVVAITGSGNLCPGGTVLLTGTSGGTSQWYQDGVLIGGATTNTYSASVAGVYNMIKTNLNGCYDSAAVGKTVVNVTSPVVALGSDVTACGSTTLDAGNAGSTYLWSNSSTGQTLAASSTGNYAVTVTDANTCTGTDDVNITINTNPTVNLGSAVTQCGGSVPLDAGNAGASYLWNDGTTTQTLSATATGNYAVTVTDANTCTGTDNVDITINTVPTVALGNDVTQCGGSVPLDAGNAGATFAWSDGTTTTQTLSATATGNYAVTVTDANTCTGTDNVDVTINTVPTVALGNDVTQCGGSVPLDAGNSGATYLWSDGTTTQTLSATATGNYAVTVTDANTCTGTDDVDVTINTNPTVTLGNAVTQCGGSVSLDAGNAGSTFAWSDGTTTTQILTVTATGNYAVTVTDANTCTGTDNVDVTINTIPTATLSLPQDSACSGSSAIALSGSPAGGTFSGTNVTGSSFNPSSVGTYTVAYAYSDNNGCKDTAYADITVYVCVGINELSFGSVELYPNPASDFVTLKTMGIEGKIQIEIFDMSGKKVDQMSGVSISSGYTYTLNLTTYAAGAYVVNVTTQNGSVRYNLIVQ